MRLILLNDYEAISDFAAKYVCKRINEFGSKKDEECSKLFTLGLPTGSTPLGMYQKLVWMCRAKQLSFASVRTFNMDEYVGIPWENPQSYHRFMFDNLFSHVDIDPNNVNIPDGNANSLAQECARYEQQIQQSGGIELFISGIGSDGHMAFNEPFSSLTSRTRVQALNRETIAANSRFFQNDQSKVPTKAITVGVQTIMDAKEVLMLCSGAQKATALREAIECGVSHACTASALQMHPNCTWLVDEEATQELKVKTVNYFRAQQADYRRELLLVDE